MLRPFANGCGDRSIITIVTQPSSKNRSQYPSLVLALYRDGLRRGSPGLDLPLLHREVSRVAATPYRGLACGIGGGACDFNPGRVPQARGPVGIDGPRAAVQSEPPGSRGSVQRG